MPSATVTIRELKNKDTGIDITVPRFTQSKGLLQATFEYQVVVVSNLPYFKSPKHKEQDVVQFMVSKKFSEFEDLWSKLNEKYPATVLPPLPKKALLSNDKIATERRGGLESFMKFLACTPKMCTTSLLLEFLGVNAIKAGKFVKEETPKLTDAERKGSEEEDTSPQSGIFEDDDDSVDDEEMFKEEKDDLETESFKPANVNRYEDTEAKLFDDPDLGGAIDESDSSLFIRGAKTTEEPKQTTSADTEDNSDLLRVEDDLDELLQITTKSTDTRSSSETPSKPTTESNTHSSPKTTPKPKPAPRSKPQLPKKPDSMTNKPSTKPKPEIKPKPKTKGGKLEDQSDVANLNTDDIMKYITDAGAQQEEVDLFS